MAISRSLTRSFIVFIFLERSSEPFQCFESEMQLFESVSLSLDAHKACEYLARGCFVGTKWIGCTATESQQASLVWIHARMHEIWLCENGATVVIGERELWTGLRLKNEEKNNATKTIWYRLVCIAESSGSPIRRTIYADTYSESVMYTRPRLLSHPIPYWCCWSKYGAVNKP